MRQLKLALGTALFLLGTKSALTQNKTLYGTENTQKPSSIPDEALNVNRNLSTTFSNNEIVPLKVGDQIPEIYLKNVLNYKSNSINLADYKGKLIILDFWSVWCSVCIAQFPKIEKLQQKYGDQVLLLPIGFDNPVEGSIEKYLAETKGTSKQVNLPSAVIGISDSTISKLFPFTGLPYEIWIDQTGKIIGMTTFKSLTEEKIQGVLNNKVQTFANKPILHSLDYDETFLINRNDNVVYGSAITGFIDTLSNQHVIGNQYSNKDNLRIFDVNKTIYSYYKWAYWDILTELKGNSGNKRIIVDNAQKDFYQDITETKDLNDVEYEAFSRKNFFCYELLLPKETLLAEAKQSLRSDFDKFFKIKSSIQKRKTNCWLITETGANSKYKSTNPQKIVGSIRVDSLSNVSFAEVSMDQFIDYLNLKFFKDDPILNHTGYTGLITTTINLGISSIVQLNSELSKIGLKLNKDYIAIDMLVLDNKSQ